MPQDVSLSTTPNLNAQLLRNAVLEQLLETQLRQRAAVPPLEFKPDTIATPSRIAKAPIETLTLNGAHDDLKPQFVDKRDLPFDRALLKALNDVRSRERAAVPATGSIVPESALSGAERDIALANAKALQIKLERASPLPVEPTAGPHPETPHRL